MMPLFIVFESLDGGGKSTQAKMLVDALNLRPGCPALLTREPTTEIHDYDGRPKVYSVADPHAAALLFAADRRLHQCEIEGTLSAGIHVVCDRYQLSLQAYQSASGVDLDWLISLDAGCRVPDLTIYLAITPEEAMERLAGKPGPNHDLARLSAVHRCYAAALARAADAGHRLALVDARGTPDEVHARILVAVYPLLGP